VESPHNDYLHVAADLGLPGLLLLAATLAGIVWHGVRQAQGEEGPVRSVRAGGVGGITALLVAALVGYPMHTASGLCALAGLAALAVAEPGGRDGTGLPPSWAARLLAAAGVIALLHTARLLIVFAASMHLHSGEEALLNRDLPEAALHLERAYEVWPRDSAVRAALGRAYLGAGRPDLALPFLEAGLRGHDSARTRTLLGRTYMTLGRTEAAAETFRVGEAAFPGYAPFHATYGAFLASQGQFPEAGRELERALALDQKLGDAYYWLGNVREREGDAAGAARALRRFLATAAADDPRRGPAAGQLAALEGPPSRVDNRTEPVR
jgi:Flp pilus assembly protein TadD